MKGRFLLVSFAVAVFGSTDTSFALKNSTDFCAKHYERCKEVCVEKYPAAGDKSMAYKGCLFRCKVELKFCEAKGFWQKFKPTLEEKLNELKEWFKGFLQK